LNSPLAPSPVGEGWGEERRGEERRIKSKSYLCPLLFMRIKNILV